MVGDGSSLGRRWDVFRTVLVGGCGSLCVILKKKLAEWIFFCIFVSSTVNENTVNLINNQ